MRKLNIIVTGGYGFIGSRFVKHVIDNTEHNVIIIDKKTYAADTNRITIWLDEEKDGGRIKHFVEDIADPDLNSKVNGAFFSVDYVVNFAAETHVDNSIEDGSPFIKSNIEGVFNLLEICRKHSHNLKRFVQVGTDEVYGDMDDLPVNIYPRASEEYSLRPSSYYSASKASADLLVQSWGRTYEFPYLITRCCNNYGPNQDEEKFIPKMLKCVKEDTPIPVYGDGNQVREWIHTDEHAEAIYSLMVKVTLNGIYNIGRRIPQSYRNKDIIAYIEDIVGRPIKCESVEDRLGHDKMYAINSSKLHNLIKIKGVYPTLGELLKEEIDNADSKQR